MKNLYPLTVKYFKNADKLFVNRENDRYFISEGHIIVKMSVTIYEQYMAVKVPRLIKLENGSKAMSEDKKKPCDSEKSYDLFTLYNKILRQGLRTDYKISVTPLMVDPTGDSQPCRIFMSGRGYTVINEVYYSIIREWYPTTDCFGQDGNTYYNYDSKSPIIIEGYDSAVIALPVNVGQTLNYAIGAIMDHETAHAVVA